MDTIDLTILSILKEDARTPLKEIQEKVYLSVPAISARIAAMKKSGVLTAFTVQLDPYQLGYQFKAFISVDVPPEKRAAFEAFAFESANVMECCRMAGAPSMLLKVTFFNMDELNDYMNRLEQYGKANAQIAIATSFPPRGVPLPPAKE